MTITKDQLLLFYFKLATEEKWKHFFSPCVDISVIQAVLLYLRHLLLYNLTYWHAEFLSQWLDCPLRFIHPIQAYTRWHNRSGWWWGTMCMLCHASLYLNQLVSWLQTIITFHPIQLTYQLPKRPCACILPQTKLATAIVSQYSDGSHYVLSLQHHLLRWDTHVSFFV